MVEIEIINAPNEANNNNNADYHKKELLAQVDMELVYRVRQLLKEDYESNSENDSKYSQYHYEELMDSSSPLACWRYLIHCNKIIEDSFSLMKSALIWRKENKIDESIHKVDPEMPKELYHLSPFTITGFDNLNNDVLYVLGKNYRKPDNILKDTITKFVIQSLLKWDNEHRNDLNQLCIVFDVSDTGYRNIDLDLMTSLIAMRDYIPARINRVFVIGIPFVVRPLVRVIISWLPEKFRKIVHCGTFEQLIAPNISIENLPREVGGCADGRRKLAPIDSPWLDDSPKYADEAMRKAIEASIGFNVPSEYRDKLRALQMEQEDKVGTRN